MYNLFNSSGRIELYNITLTTGHCLFPSVAQNKSENISRRFHLISWWVSQYSYILFITNLSLKLDLSISISLAAREKINSEFRKFKKITNTETVAEVIIIFLKVIPPTKLMKL